MTGLLSPRHAPREGVNQQEGPGPVSAPPPRGTRLLPAIDRLAAELAATDPWRTEVPFDRWLSDTYVGGMLAIEAGA